jgi:UDP-N-acetylglucosamine 2-epimerase (non-hydrolysing)
MMKILTVLGTRPEAIKCLPVLCALAAADGAESVICDTGQHRELTKPMFALWGMQPDYQLELMQTGQSLCGLMARALAQLEPVLAEVKPDRVLVQGDTLTAYSAAMAAFLMKIPVGHIEAGLRSHDLSAPWPEEFNRRAIGITTDLHLAPTEQAKADLLAENYPAAQIHVTGNTVIDALYMFREKMHADAALKAELAARFTMLEDAKKLVLVTSHRRENFDGGIEAICAALKTLAARDDIELIFPVHPNPNVKAPVEAALGAAPNIHLIEPQDYLGFLYLMDRAHLILSDSGGVQEEAPSLQKPLLVMRDTTERPEGVKAGVAKLVGTDTQTIIREATRLLDDPTAYAAMQGGQALYGDGKAAERIVKLILAHKGESHAA